MPNRPCFTPPPVYTSVGTSSVELLCGTFHGESLKGLNRESRHHRGLFRGCFHGHVRGVLSWAFSLPCPSFPCFFLEKGKENHQKNKDFFTPTEPLKSLEKERKTLKKTRNSSQGKKNKEFHKNKERKGRVERDIPRFLVEANLRLQQDYL